MTAAADSLSYVGKKVTSETAVFLDGMPFDTAAIVDGTSLAPIRRVYETAGYKVTYKDGKVYLESPKTASNGGDSLNTHSPDKKRVESLRQKRSSRMLKQLRRKSHSWVQTFGH